MIRYRDGKIVSTKGERFTQVSKAESEEMKKSIVGSSSSHSLCWRLALAGGGKVPPPVNATIGYALPEGSHHVSKTQAIHDTEFRKTTDPRLRDPSSWPPLAAVSEFMQPKAHSFGELCTSPSTIAAPFPSITEKSCNQMAGSEPDPPLEFCNTDGATCVYMPLLSVLQSFICSVLPQPSSLVHSLEVGSCNVAFSTSLLLFQCTLPLIR